MDIPRLSMAQSQERVSTSVGISMMKKAMDRTEQNGEAIAKMIEQATAPAQVSGGGVDLKV